MSLPSPQELFLCLWGVQEEDLISETSAIKRLLYCQRQVEQKCALNTEAVGLNLCMQVKLQAPPLLGWSKPWGLNNTVAQLVGDSQNCELPPLYSSLLDIQILDACQTPCSAGAMVTWCCPSGCACTVALREGEEKASKMSSQAQNKIHARKSSKDFCHKTVSICRVAK